MSAIHIECFTEPVFGENAYVVDVGARGPCWVVDPGLPPSAAQIIEHIDRRGLSPAAIVLTHAHADHIAGVDEVLARWPDLPAYVSDGERAMLGDPARNLSMLGGMAVRCSPKEVRALEPPGPVQLGDTSWTILDVAGHSPAGRALYCREAGVAIVGDALFEGSIGRTDFPGSNHDRFLRNIREHLLSLPDETIVYSGHGPATTIGRERRFNPFLQ
ncbi:MAG: MBL fold metallo-hydrolase [Phycisphaerae bacterium]|nr:MBL fold metallo-hydrolase [Phycisphaerae bacterium]